MILLVSEPWDDHADAMEVELDRRGVTFVRFAYSDFPAAQVSVRITAAGSATIRFSLGGRSINLAEVTGVWLRRPGVAHLDHAIPQVAAMVADETGTVLDDLWHLTGATLLPAAPSVIRYGQLRLRQLRIASDLGFEIPATLAGNAPDDALEFLAEHPRAVVKHAGLCRLDARPGETLTHFTERVHPRDLVEIDAVALCPISFQSEIPKKDELRVTVVGERVFAAAIDAAGHPRAGVDWRRDRDGEVAITAAELPVEVADRCRAVTRALGLRYGALDLVRTPDNHFVFIEINPSGQYLWIEQATGMPITAAIADELGGAARPEGSRP